MTATTYQPDLYNIVHSLRTKDVEWYKDLAKKANKPILELGAGTGRTILPIARAGIQIHAIEYAIEMRNYLLKHISDEEPTLSDYVILIEDDMASFNLDTKFNLIQIPFRGFLHNINRETQLACLTCCYKHLTPGGVLAFDVFMPSDSYMNQFKGKFSGIPRIDDPYPLASNGSWLVLTEWNDYDNGAKIVKSMHRYDMVENNGIITKSSLQILELAILYPDDIISLLKEIGFSNIKIYGGFAEEKIESNSQDLVILASKP